MKIVPEGFRLLLGSQHNFFIVQVSVLMHSKDLNGLKFCISLESPLRIFHAAWNIKFSMCFRLIDIKIIDLTLMFAQLMEIYFSCYISRGKSF